MDRKKNDLLFGRRENDCRQIASLTKIMTATVILNACDELQGVDLDSKIKIVPRAANINGTSAELICGDLLRVTLRDDAP